MSICWTGLKATEDKRKVWRVTFLGEPISKTHLMGETIIVILALIVVSATSVRESAHHLV